MIQALQFLLDIFLGLWGTMVLLRFYMQLTGVPFRNPVSQAIVALTNFAVVPARKIIPSWRSIDLSTLFLAIFTAFLLRFLTLWLHGYFPHNSGDWITILLLSLLDTIRLSIQIFMYGVIIQALLSWINPYTPIAPMLETLTRPVLNPFRRYIPPFNGLDLSPLFVFIVAQLILMLAITPLQQNISALF
jgi:YggT family protein